MLFINTDFIFLQRDVKVTLNVLLLKLVLTENVWILVPWKDVVLMHFVQQKITELCAPVQQATDLTPIHTSGANSMSV